MELNREQITKALELHSQAEKPCLRECPYGNLHYCGAEMAKDTVALIKQLTEENERLRNTMVDYRNISEIIVKTKAATVREFAERVKAELNDCCRYVSGNREYFIVGKELIDQIAKEMLEGGENDTLTE